MRRGDRVEDVMHTRIFHTASVLLKHGRQQIYLNCRSGLVTTPLSKSVNPQLTNLQQWYDLRCLQCAAASAPKTFHGHVEEVQQVIMSSYISGQLFYSKTGNVACVTEFAAHFLHRPGAQQSGRRTAHLQAALCSLRRQRC